jgi:hypothetical protein
VVNSALEVTEDALHGREMGLTGILHVESHLLNHVGDVRPGEDEELESPGQAVVGSWVTDGYPHVRGNLRLSVDRRGAGFALKDVPSVLALVKDEVVRPLLH